MGLAWQQGPLAPGAVGTFLVPGSLPEHLLYAEPLRRRMSVTLAGQRIAHSDDVILLHEPGRYPVAYFPKGSVSPGTLLAGERLTEHRLLGSTAWYEVSAGAKTAPRAAWEHVALPAHADVLTDHVAFAWQAMDAFYEEAERIVGHAADPYHRIDIRRSARRLVARAGGALVAETERALVLYESGFAPRWYVPRGDVVPGALTPVQRQTFCPYKGLCGYFDIGDIHQAAWGYPEPYRGVERIADFVSFEPDKVEVTLDGQRLPAEPGQQVVSHGPDRRLTPDEVNDVELPESLRWPAVP